MQEDREKRAREILARKDLRVTRQRLLVLAALVDDPHDATAQKIHERLRAEGREIGLATVYRTLGALSEADVVDTLSHLRGETCYRLCGEEHHHHLLCSECHRIVELTNCGLEDWIDGVAAEHGFTASSHEIELVGVCSDCRIRQSA